MLFESVSNLYRGSGKDRVNTKGTKEEARKLAEPLVEPMRRWVENGDREAFESVTAKDQKLKDAREIAIKMIKEKLNARYNPLVGKGVISEEGKQEETAADAKIREELTRLEKLQDQLSRN